jgi:hypothetical protein
MEIIRPGNSHRALLVAFALFAVIWSTGCTVSGSDAELKASAIDEGATEEQLVKAAGAPSRRVVPPHPDCAQGGGTHELIYDTTIQYLGGWLGEVQSSLVAFCIDPSSTIIQKTYVEF